MTYLLPFAVTGFAVIYAGPPGSLQTICTKMNAPFLLNNSIPTEVNMTEMFQMRLKSERTSCAMYGLRNVWVAQCMGCPNGTSNIQNEKSDLGEVCEVYNFLGCFKCEFVIYN